MVIYRTPERKRRKKARSVEPMVPPFVVDPEFLIFANPAPIDSMGFIISEIACISPKFGSLPLETCPDDCGKLSLSVAPGKTTPRTQRDLEADLKAIKSQGYDTIVCLLEWGEMEKIMLVNYPLTAQEHFRFLHFPIKDMSVPRMEEAKTFIPMLASLLHQGKKVLLHCRQGLGRAGLIAACSLLHFGLTPDEAIQKIRERRKGAIQTDEQRRFVRTYYRNTFG